MTKRKQKRRDRNCARVEPCKWATIEKEMNTTRKKKTKKKAKKKREKKREAATDRRMTRREELFTEDRKRQTNRPFFPSTGERTIKTVQCLRCEREHAMKSVRDGGQQHEMKGRKEEDWEAKFNGNPIWNTRGEENLSSFR